MYSLTPDDMGPFSDTTAQQKQLLNSLSTFNLVFSIKQNLPKSIYLSTNCWEWNFN